MDFKLLELALLDALHIEVNIQKIANL